MPHSKFRIGQLVRLQLDQGIGAPDLYQVVRILTGSSSGDLQYRLKGIYEAHERMVTEHQISPATKPRDGAPGQIT
jgi:hypothetical protein